MPKSIRLKLGDPDLDQKQSPLKLPLAHSKKEKEENHEYFILKKIMRYVKMMEHFGINPKDKNSWMYLSIELAERFVPEVDFKKSDGAPTKWDHETLWALHALYSIAKYENPNFKEYQIYELLPEMAQNTILADLIKPSTQPESIRRQYRKYIKSPEFQIYNEGMDKYPEMDLMACHYHILYLSDKK